VKRERKSKISSPMRKWEDNIKIYFMQLRSVDVDQWQALVNTVVNLQVP
jgi:hypothetical protein